MHDSGRTESLHDAAPQTTAIRHPATLPLTQTGIALLFWCWGANSHCAGKARMPYKMNAQSFKQGCLKAAALSCHTMWQPKRLTRHDAKPTEQARRARMHDSGRTKSAQGRADPNDRILTNPATLSPTQ